MHGAEVRGWPHHFDLAALHVLDPEREPELARSVGAGFSPGDGSYEQPYFYVTPWSAPERSSLPQLSGGAHWHTAGFTSAVLPGHVVAEAAEASEQERLVQEFLESSVSAAYELLS